VHAQDAEGDPARRAFTLDELQDRNYGAAVAGFCEYVTSPAYGWAAGTEQAARNGHAEPPA
jgi:hypothetical protein